MITKQVLQALRADVNEALKAVAAKHGLGLELGNATFDPRAGIAKFVMLVAAPSASGATDHATVKAEAEWKELASLYRLDPKWLGASGVRPATGATFKVLGLVSSRAKFPVLCDVGGKRLLLTIEEVRRSLATAP